MNDNSSFNLRPPTPKPSSANKALIWGLLIIIVLIIIAIVVSALRTPAAPKQEQTPKLAANAQTAQIPSFSQLPSDYSSHKVSQYLPQQDNSSNDAMKAQLQALQQKQTALENQLAQANKNTNQQLNNSDATTSNQAAFSSLFFEGTSPNQANMKASQTAAANNTVTAQTGNQPTPSHYEQQNMQAQKVDFIKNSAKDQDDIYNQHNLVYPMSPYEVQAGTLIPAILMTAINTSLPGEIVARVMHDVYSSVTGQFLLIPKGSKLIGQYDSQVSYGQNRVLIVFNRVIRPDGSSILLSSAPGADLFGQAGAVGQSNQHWGRIIGAAVLSTILSVGSGAVANNSFGNHNQYYPSPAENAILAGGSALSQTGQGIVNKQLNLQPTLVIPVGYEFNIIVNKDMILNPYQSAHGHVDIYNRMVK